jgi:HTH-type transcriptional regulator / antitoxin HigA
MIDPPGPQGSEPVAHPGTILRRLLDERGWSQDELAAVTGHRRQTISSIVARKSGVTPEMAVALGAAFGNDPADWLKWDSDYALSIINSGDTQVQTRARLYGLAPIRDMQKRGWIKNTTNIQELEAELKRFFDVASLDEQPEVSVAPKRAVGETELSPIQKAWCIRAKSLARLLRVGKFDPARMPTAERELRELAAYRPEARHLPRVLSTYGVRFVVVEPLPRAKIDGAAFWLDKESPVIAVSVRYDRLDGFWHTVMHECSHIRHGDALSVDTEIVGESIKPDDSERERRANREAAATLIPPAELESFIRRVGPLYARRRIIQFAHTLKIHPGIIVGQLQHRGEIGYSGLRDLLVKVRDVVTETALTDGWGKSISPGLA